MPPKVKVSRELIITAALEIVRKNGEAALNARNIAGLIGCSTQPIFSNFPTMDDLKIEVTKKAVEIYNDYSDTITQKYGNYKAEAMAYITFAKEDNNLFKLLFLMNDDNSLNSRLEQKLYEEMGISGDTARLFNLEMWAFVHGMATLTANASFPLHEAVISRIFDDAFEGLKSRFNV